MRFRILSILGIVCLLLTACSEEKQAFQPELIPESPIIQSDSVPADDETKSDSSAIIDEIQSVSDDKTSASDKDTAVVKINGGADKNGIYSIMVRITDKAADKAVIELIYYGAKGTSQENSIVNTFRIEYYKEDAGTYEIKTYSDGEIYLNHHHKDEVKVVNTFGATLRAGNVTVTYTPDGGETQEVFTADADYFYSE